MGVIPWMADGGVLLLLADVCRVVAGDRETPGIFPGCQYLARFGSGRVSSEFFA